MKLTEITNQFLTNHDEIKAWLDEMGIEDYKIASGGKVSVNGEVYISNRQLTSIPVQFEEVDGAFYCNDNMLTSLVGCPSKVGSNFYCSHNKLLSLKGCPSKVGKVFACNNNKLTSLVGCPSKVGGDFYCHKNKLTSLVGISDLIESMNGTFNFDARKIKSGGLGLLLIKGLTSIITQDTEAFYFIDGYIGQQDKIFECQEKLIEAGLEEYAQL